MAQVFDLYVPSMVGPPPAVGLSASGSGATEVYTRSFTDPTGLLVPDDLASPAFYYQDSDTLNVWRWSPTAQAWKPTITT